MPCRYMGFILQADINYDNTGTQIEESSQHEIKYHIKFTHLPRTKFSTQAPASLHPPSPQWPSSLIVSVSCAGGAARCRP